MESDEAKLATTPALDNHRISGLPPSFYYIPNFLTEEECTALLAKIPAKRWTHLSHRRLQAHPSILTANNTLIAAPLPTWLTSTPVPIIERFANLGVFAKTKHGAPNHVLVNEYQPGEGIMPHEDGAAYSPVVATISLGSSLILDLYDKPTDSVSSAAEDAGRSKPKFQILQESGSLLVTTGDAYISLLHGISPRKCDDDIGSQTVINWGLLGDRTAFESGTYCRDTRISLTYRDVIKVSKIGMGILRGK